MSEIASISKTQVIYAAADALQIDLTHEDSTLSGAKAKNVSLGPFRMSFPMVVKSDFFRESETAMFIHFRGHLWGYLYVDATEAPLKVWMYLFKSDKVTPADWRTGDPNKTFDSIQSLIVATLAFNGETWIELTDTSKPRK